VIRSHHHSEFPLELLLERKRGQVTVVLPAREVAATIGPIVERLQSLDGLVDQILVVDAASADGSAEIAERLGADVRQEAELLPEFGPVLGKGDAMWRALAAVRGEVVVYLDSDTGDFSPHFATGLMGPLIADPAVQFVKAAYRRPFFDRPEGGGRVNELMARPLLSAFYPELAGFAQPLAGEMAARRELLERIPYATGYAVETAMLLSVLEALGGTDGMAQVDLDLRRNRHQPLAALGPMAYAVLGVIHERLRREGRLEDGQLEGVETVERPPFATVAARA
jgi:glucosyl-3-phosphoglycerate synthase